MGLSIVDLFCGSGGFSFGFSNISNGKHLAIDSDSIPLATYSLNYPKTLTLRKDINRLHSLEIEKILGNSPDIILASPPCEEFSQANPNSDRPAAERVYGTGTARLLLDTIRLIGDLSPKVFIIENVAALLQVGGKQIITKELEHVGFDEVWFNLVRAHQHGNPSKRLRVFISNIKLKLPRERPPTVIETIGNLPPLGINAILTNAESPANHDYRSLTEDKLKKVRKTKWGKGARVFHGSKGKEMPNWVRLHPNQVSTSIIGLSRYIHPFEDRLLTVREHARLMSYPDSFVFTGHTDSMYNQVGESVPPLISQLLAKEVMKHIE